MKFDTHILPFVIGMSSVLISRLARMGERKFGSKCAGPVTTLSARFGDCAQFFNRVVSIYMHACCTHSLRRHLTHVPHLLAAKVYDIVWDETIANGEANDISHYMELMVELFLLPPSITRVLSLPRGHYYHCHYHSPPRPPSLLLLNPLDRRS